MIKINLTKLTGK